MSTPVFDTFGWEAWASLAPALSFALAAWLTRGAPDGHTARARAGLGALVSLVVALLAATFARIDGPSMHFDSWGPFSFALDELSAPLVPFVAALACAVVVGTPTRFVTPGYVARLLASAGLSIALLAAHTPLTLALLWALSGVPTLLELRGRRGLRIFAAQHLVSTTLVLAGVLLAKSAADPADPVKKMHDGLQSLAAPLLVLGIMVREGIFPFHAWVPRFFVRAPLGSALLFIQPQLGAYVLARWVLIGPLAGSASWLLDVLGAITMIYGAALALGQRSARRALGYLAVSQSALVLLGLADGGVLGATGALLVIAAVGLAQTGFGLTLSATEARRGTLRLDVDAGGHSATPALAGSTLMLGLASVGLPGTLAFVAEDLVFHATLEARPWIGVLMVMATALNGIAVLRIAFRLFGGRRRSTGEGDLTLRERAVLGLVGATLVTLGLMPQPVLAPAKEALEHLTETPSLSVHAVATRR